MSKKKNRGRIVHGLFVLDKPLGMSSNQALQRVKHAFNARKAGHSGTLDPLASGVLVICLGKATKIVEHIMLARKTYQVTAKLGVTTTTADSEGEVLATADVTTDQLAKLPSIVKSFEGEIEQVPPMFSALKHEGQPLYKLARQGEDVVREPRKVKIYSNQLSVVDAESFNLTVSCSKGTYIRTLVEDIGKQLGCGAHVSVLRRLQVGEFGEQYPMHTLQELEQSAQTDNLAVAQFKLPLTAAFTHYPKFELKHGIIQVFERGARIKLEPAYAGKISSPYVRIYDTNGAFYGLGEVCGAELAQFQKIYSF